MAEQISTIEHALNKSGRQCLSHIGLAMQLAGAKG